VFLVFFDPPIINYDPAKRRFGVVSKRAEYLTIMTPVNGLEFSESVRSAGM